MRNSLLDSRGNRNFGNMFDVHTHKRNAEWRGSAIVNLKVDDNVDMYPYFSLGIHPWDVDELWTDKLQRLKCTVDKLVSMNNSSFCAIGEIGLDHLKGGSMDLQIRCFEEQLGMAEYYAKPVIVHCVKAFDETLQVIKSLKFSMPVVFHGFRGKPEQARQLLDKGFYISFGPKFNPSSMKLAYAEGRMFLETDDSGTDIASVYESAGRVLNISPTDIPVPGIFTS